MTPEQEIERYKREFSEHWELLEKIPEIQQAIAEKNIVALGELVAAAVYGNLSPQKGELPKYAIEGARSIIKNGSTAKWKTIFRNSGIPHGNFESTDEKQNEAALARAIQLHHQAEEKKKQYS